MSRSTQLKKEIKSGPHLVILDAARKHESDLIVTFTNHENKSFEKIYDIKSTEFIKMCGDAGAITETSILKQSDTKKGLRLWIYIKEVWRAEIADYYIFETKPFDPNNSNPPKVRGEFIERDYKSIATDKLKVIQEAREMIKQVESGQPKYEM
jgi:hypothetical protein